MGITGILLLACIQTGAQSPKKINRGITATEARKRYTPPHFPGGDAALVTFLRNRMRYPRLARENELQGMVHLSFFINEQGQPEDIRITRDIGGGCGAEAVRVVKQMPQWLPATYGGRKVRAWYELPVSFILQ